MDAGSDCLTDLVADEIGVRVEEDDGFGWPLAFSRYSFVASLTAGDEQFRGLGCGLDAEDARRRAIVECLERYAQFGCAATNVRVATGAALDRAAIPPDSFGLYSDNQYAAPDFPFARYSSHELLEWIPAVDVPAREPSYLPVEFVYPRARLDRKPLVAETSNGTAAHTCRAAALLSAICELIERDSLMMFWHRQPPTPLLPLGSRVMAPGTADLELIRQMGFVVTVLNLQYDLGVPCVLVVALRGDRYACGSACHPSVNRALEGALRELGISLRWQLQGGRSCRTPLAEVRMPQDHSALYDGGPFHRLLRDALENTIRPSPAEIDNRDEGTLTDEEALDIVVRSIENRGYRIHEFDLTPASLKPCGLTVRRALVPGLIPLYFGLNNLRLGCRRFWGSESPGRFCTLMPHFLR